MDEYKQYHENGYCVIDDFLLQNIAEELNTIYCSTNKWKRVNQVRESHYREVFPTKSPYFPGEEEHYMAKFERSEQLEASERVQITINEYFKPVLLEISKLDLNNYQFRSYRLQKGDFIRTHIDDFIGDIGCIYYVNKDWIWDWGGILHFGLDDPNDDSITAVFPKFNRVVIVNHGEFKFPHFVSTVSSFAQNPRYTLVSFNSVEVKQTSNNFYG